MDWRDLRILLAVGQHPRLSEAARSVDLDPTTVSRRVRALEDTLGVVLFRRTPKSWTPTEAGSAVLRRCAAMAGEVRGLRDDLDRTRGDVHGTVRLTGLDSVLSTWIVPAVPTLHRDHPDLALELYATNATVDLLRGRADVALRMERPVQAGLVARKLTEIALVIAARPEVLALPPADRPVVMVGFMDTKGVENTALRTLGGRPVLSTTSMAVSDALVLSGQALGVVPRRIANASGLSIVDEAVPPRSLWRAVPEALVDAPRIRAVTTWLDTLFA